MFAIRKRKVFVGLSGGVDSAVSAALLQRQGYNVIGAFIRISLAGYPCTASEDRREAIRVATHLKIPFVDIDLSEAYMAKVFTPSLHNFIEGGTPNPDVLCNREIKFGLFYEFALKQGADYVATGHYARTRRQGQETTLYKGRDNDKDQSYFLWMMPPNRLERVIFPVGDLIKTEVRKMAQQFKVPNADRRDSQGLCFLGEITTEDMIKKESLQRSGDVLDSKGRIIGKHEGAALYTLGQRHGYTLIASSPSTPAHFVIAKDVLNNTITISSERIPSGYKTTTVVITEPNWIGSIHSGEYMARFRYRQTLIRAAVTFDVDTVHIVLMEPHLVPVGQSLVFYDRDRCLGGGIVRSAVMEG